MSKLVAAQELVDGEGERRGIRWGKRNGVERALLAQFSIFGGAQVLLGAKL